MKLNAENIVNEVSVGLLTAETDCDRALASAFELGATIARVRLEAGLPFGAGMNALADASEAVSLTVRARRYICRSHARLLEDAIEHKVVAEGDIVPTFTEKAVGEVDRGLRLVA